MALGIPLDHVIARNLRELIEQRGIHHATLAAWMRAVGIDWTANRVAQTVTLRRSLSLLELAALCNLLGVPLDRLLGGDDEVALPRQSRDTDSGPDVTAPLAVIRDVLRDGGSDGLPDEGRGWHKEQSVVAVYTPDPIEDDVARRLDTDVSTVRGIAARLYGDTHVSLERDRRAGDLSDATPATARAKRGHAMRGILAEMRDEIRKWGQERERMAAELAQREATDPDFRASMEELRSRGLAR